MLIDERPTESDTARFLYDAAYLELAIRERLAIATLDAALEKAAQAEGVVILGDNRL